MTAQLIAATSTAIPVPADKLLRWLDEIGRQRALADDETDILEALVCRGHRSSGVRTRWTPQLDAGLLDAATVDGGIKRYAEEIGVRPMSCHMRLHKIRKRHD